LTAGVTVWPALRRRGASHTPTRCSVLARALLCLVVAATEEPEECIQAAIDAGIVPWFQDALLSTQHQLQVWPKIQHQSS
jgi:hypothetical protein